ncbi:MAG: saccharopine dehydrogenase NADP-binding domain-containing protein [Chitinophagales bacterium]
MKEGWLIYGCYGYTGRLICEHAVKLGLKPVIAGRDARRTEELAKELGLAFRVFSLDSEEQLVKELEPFKLVLHCAGPFIYTCAKMVKACLAAKTHYLDITGEYQVFERIYRKDQEAKDAGILLMPGVGFDVVPSDCLAAYLKEKLPTGDTLDLALMQKGGKLSHGTAITIAENMGEDTTIRRKGKLDTVPNGTLTRVIEVKGSQKKGVAISWGDVSSAWRSTKVPNITVYNVLPQRVIDGMRWSGYLAPILSLRLVKKFVINRIKKRPAGPNEEMRQSASGSIYGEIRNPLGISKSALLELPEGYTLTYLTAVEIVKQLLNGLPATGAKTPSQVFGKDFILQFEDVKRTDLD